MTNMDNQLPISILIDWFKKSLVITEENDVLNINKTEQVLKNHIAKTNSIQYLGNNEKKISIIVKDEFATYLDEGSLQFLTNILQACNLNLGDIALINIEQQKNIHYKQLKEELHITKCLLFGISSEKIHLPLTFPSFKSQLYDSISFAHAPDLATINNSNAESKLLKAKLWTCLQEFFNLI